MPSSEVSAEQVARSDLRQLDMAEAPAGARLDRVLAAAWPDLSRSRIQELIRAGAVSLDGAPLQDPSARPPRGGEIMLREPPPVAADPVPERIPLAVVYEDDELIVVDKPAGLVVHEGAGHGSGTLVNALLAHCGDSLSGIGGVRRPGIVHRLDKDTSGLMVAAKTDRAHRDLAAQFADHGRSGDLRRAYLAFVWGRPEPSKGSVEAALARSTGNREKMAVTRSGGRHAVTHYEVVEDFTAEGDEPVASLVRCTLETGRTHQIRVHMAHLRHPVIGDPVYGAGFRTKAARLAPETRAVVEGLPRQALHAALLQFRHPATGEIQRFEGVLPPDLDVLHRTLQNGSARRGEAIGANSTASR